jgi:hypothetical protein
MGQHTDKSGLGGIVQNIKQKLSQPADAAAEVAPQPEPVVVEVDSHLQQMLTTLRQELEKTRTKSGDSGKDVRASLGNALIRAKLLEMILPEVLNGEKIESGQGFVVNKLRSKEWAYSLGDAIGLLAGLLLPKDKIPGAIAEIAKEAIAAGEAADAAIGALGIITKKPTAPADGTPSGPSAEAIKREEREKTAQSLEDQASLETEPAARAALEQMAKRIRKELELDSSARA